MRHHYFLAAGVCLFSALTTAAPPKEGREYDRLNNKISGAPAVVEFFSFYCSPCMKFEEVYGISDAVDRKLPAGIKTEKYHISQLGPLGHALTRAWSVAVLLGVENKVRGPLFEASMIKHTLNNEADIRQIFLSAGISGEEYDGTGRSFAASALTEKQERMARQFAVTATPVVYVNGQYRVSPQGFRSVSVADFSASFAETVRFLAQQTET
ncbi:DsbA family protein [Enterobacter hormaechei]